MVLNDYFIGTEDSFFQFDVDGGHNKSFPVNLNLRCMIMLFLLMLSGNVQPNPGPITSMHCSPTPSDFKSRTGLGFIH